MDERQKAFNIEWIALTQPEIGIYLFLLILFDRYSFIYLWYCGHRILWLPKDFGIDRFMVGLILLCMHYALATEFGKISELTSISTRKSTFVVYFWRSSKISPGSKSHLLLGPKLLLEEVANGIFTLLFPVLLGADINNSGIINL